MVRAIRTRIRAWGLLALLLAASFAVQAQRVEGDRARAEGVYAAEVPVNGQGESERNGAFARGLAQVLSKLSGDRAVASRPGVGQELRKARDYVERYDYRQDEGVSATGAPSFRTTLVVQYEQEKVDDLVATLGIPVWPQPRPKPVLWLAIDDGSGPRLVGVGQVNAARPVLNRAVERGYKLGLPAGNAAEQAVVGAIWRGDSAAVARASARYSPPMQLIGKLYRDAKAGWKADWIFVDNGKVLSSWSQTGSDARQVMATGADGAADALMKRYAKAAAAGPAGVYRIAFTGLRGGEDYIRLAGYLQKLSVVRRITPVRATAQNVELDLDLVSGLPGLERATRDDGVIAPLEGLEGQPPVYVLR
ncbi:DUF2066 domain-containing protein [Vulcaniibacterium tengchongense]|uniref:DUF2066 domain-containing protein n=1 Tax=Vulcaniibacterium tengchongense TaxID=1273429 RepID=A0A3N4VDE9_9GAMM|nr:DUF2066 domain-containing protein [Vulcaniibacterium tengchongense]RPE81032.1 hypothetical protein EDC50_0199 [Vulcaniibacterium tengchongense]